MLTTHADAHVIAGSAPKTDNLQHSSGALVVQPCAHVSPPTFATGGQLQGKFSSGLM